MRNVHFTVSRAANGYTINYYDGDTPFTTEALDECHVARTQEDAAKVVKGIIRGAFGDDKVPRKKAKGSPPLGQDPDDVT